MSNLKYKLTTETHYEDITEPVLYRIVALKDFGDVKAGDLGGFVESEDNLSQEGNCWITDDAKVFDDAFICDNAIISGEAKVYDTAKVCDNAIVTDDAWISGESIISGRAVIEDDEEVHDEMRYVYYKSLDGE